MKKVLVYLHGFLSSPQSVKCQATLNYMAQHHPDISIISPQIPYYPSEAITHLTTLIEPFKDAQIGYIGSSMGGFMSTHLMQLFPGKAALINPAVTPHILLKNFLGEHIHPYTNEPFTLVDTHMSELENLLVSDMKQPENFWVFLQEGDETLDYREAVEKYKHSKLTVEAGGDHSFQGYENHLPNIVSFLFD
ncbi:YqiA/YcfP family alpha/beta fold hydrolase [Alteromonas sp. a30]|uniref:YqiA/YcfP family alpha/beta fold hydrolase n=1 Tax=Alteromonas sp. a30 TaxID=2730917 RepID=UPI00227EB498|nr:YqiA/YcfP family alpha/beta fold hydrolase [Alteromonas sp. a30]MCY7296278.1 esterase YqiA [Alteromonas sp. a30]